MPVIIPGQRSNAIALVKPPSLHGIGELARAPKAIPIGISVTGVVPGYRYDLLMAVHALSVPHDRGNRERNIHHQTVHGGVVSFAVERGMYRVAVGVSNPE